MKQNPYQPPAQCEPPATPHRQFSSASLFRIGIALIVVAAPMFYWAAFVYKIPEDPSAWWQIAFLLSAAMIVVGFITVVIGGICRLAAWAFRRGRQHLPNNRP